MIPRGIKLQLGAFAVVGIAAMTYAGATVVLPTVVTPTYEVKAEFKDSSGTFTNGEVTYRGVNIGRIGKTRLLADGVEVTLHIQKSTPPIPTNVLAVVADKSAVGEEYVDLQPQTNDGPFLKNGDVILRDQTRIPIGVNALVVDLDRTVRSVNLKDLNTVVTELATATNKTADPVAKLITNSHNLTLTLQNSLPDTITLINASKTDLLTAQQTAGQLKQFAQGLSALSDQLVTSDPDLRKVVDAGIVSAGQLDTFLQQIQPNLLPLLGNLVTASSIGAARIPGLKQTLLFLPASGSGLTQAIHPVGQLYTPLTVGEDLDPKCIYPATRHLPAALEGLPIQANYYCPDDKGATAPRGARNAPRPAGDNTAGPATGPSDTGGPNPNLGTKPLFGAYDPSTGLASTANGAYFTLAPDTGLSSEEKQTLGDRSWMALLLNLISK